MEQNINKCCRVNNNTAIINCYFLAKLIDGMVCKRKVGRKPCDVKILACHSFHVFHFELFICNLKSLAFNSANLNDCRTWKNCVFKHKMAAFHMQNLVGQADFLTHLSIFNCWPNLTPTETIGKRVKNCLHVTSTISESEPLTITKTELCVFWPFTIQNISHRFTDRWSYTSSIH